MWPDRVSNPRPLALESYAIGSVDPWLYRGKNYLPLTGPMELLSLLLFNVHGREHLWSGQDGRLT